MGNVPRVEPANPWMEQQLRKKAFRTLPGPDRFALALSQIDVADMEIVGISRIADEGTKCSLVVTLQIGHFRREILLLVPQDWMQEVDDTEV